LNIVASSPSSEPSGQRSYRRLRLWALIHFGDAERTMRAGELQGDANDVPCAHIHAKAVEAITAPDGLAPRCPRPPSRGRRHSGGRSRTRATPRRHRFGLNPQGGTTYLFTASDLVKAFLHLLAGDRSCLAESPTTTAYFICRNLTLTVLIS
jgi:hypothetical protein